MLVNNNLEQLFSLWLEVCGLRLQLQQGIMAIVSFFATLLDVIYFLIHLFVLYTQALFRYFIPPALKSLTGEIILVNSRN